MTLFFVVVGMGRPRQPPCGTGARSTGPGCQPSAVSLLCGGRAPPGGQGRGWGEDP